MSLQELTVLAYHVMIFKLLKEPPSQAFIWYILLILLKDHGKFIVIYKLKEGAGWYFKWETMSYPKKTLWEAGKTIKLGLAILTENFG